MDKIQYRYRIYNYKVMKLVIFGCGKIANRIAKSCKLVENIELVGFASKDIDKAKEYSTQYECKEYGDYDYFLNSDIDAVYIATYNKSHYELIKRCLEQGKNVICEKPMLSNRRMNKEMFDLAKEKNLLLMEALKSVFLPIIIKVKDMVHSGKLGDIKEIYAAFMRNGSHSYDHWINDPSTGGALKDLGSYCVGTMNFIMDCPGKLVDINTDATADRADTTAYVDLDYDGVKGKAAVSNSLDGDTTLIIKGSKGEIRIDNFWKSGIGTGIIDDKEIELDEELISDFYYELEHFAKLVDSGIKMSPVMNYEASDNILKITDREG